jgi:hypothetical protein
MGDAAAGAGAAGAGAAACTGDGANDNDKANSSASANAVLAPNAALVRRVPARSEPAWANVGYLIKVYSPAWAFDFLASFGRQHYHRHPADGV